MKALGWLTVGADPKTARLYDRRSDQVSMDEVERIGIWEFGNLPMADLVDGKTLVMAPRVRNLACKDADARL